MTEKKREAEEGGQFSKNKTREKTKVGDYLD